MRGRNSSLAREHRPPRRTGVCGGQHCTSLQGTVCRFRCQPPPPPPLARPQHSTLQMGARANPCTKKLRFGIASVANTSEARLSDAQVNAPSARPA